MGGITMGIYIFHVEMVLLANRFSYKIESLFFFDNYQFYEYGICLITALMLIALSILIILTLRKNKYLSLIFLGEK